MCISFATYERVASSKEVAASVNKGPPRISTNEYSTCYDDLHVSDENKCKIFMKLKFDIEKEKGINFRALSPCLQSVVGNLHFNSVGAKKNSVSILIIRPNLCKSTGNILGFFFQAICFALFHGFIVGRLDPLPSETCDR